MFVSFLTSTSEAWRAPLAQRGDGGLAVDARGHGAAGARVLRLAQQAVLVLRDHGQRGLLLPVLMRRLRLHELGHYVAVCMVCLKCYFEVCAVWVSNQNQKCNSN